MGMDSIARKLALPVVLVFLVGTLLGSLLPEFGNILAAKLGLTSHGFNPCFLAVGIAGTMLALFIRPESSR